MSWLYKIIRLGFLHPRTLFCLWKAMRLHGKNLSLFLKFSAEKFGDRPALTDGIEQVSFRELYQHVLQLSYVLHQKIQPAPDDIAILLCKNEITHVLCLYALQNIGIKTILLHHKASRRDIQRITSTQTSTCHVLSSDLPAEDATRTWHIEALWAETDPKAIYRSKKFGNIVFPTSGTTGKPKLIEKRRGAFFGLIPFSDLIWRTQITRCQSVYISIPISHSLGYTALLFAGLLGKKTLLLEGKDTATVRQALLQERVEALVGVPASLYRLADSLRGTAHDVWLILSSGAPLNALIFKEISNLTTHIYSLYGSSESSTAFVADYEDLRQHVYALGKPLQGVCYQLALTETKAQELWIRSPLANLPVADGWVHSGDLVAYTANGLVWCGRQDDMILKNGVNIYPAEIEHAILGIEGVSEVCVAGKPDKIKGQTILAYLTQKEGHNLQEKDLREALRGVLSPLKIPDEIHVIDHFDYTYSGKLICPHIQ